MNAIDQTFAQLRREERAALMPFLTVGDPDPDTSLQLICELEAAGADIVELGVPYSDPLADGPVIQRASERALAHGITLLDCIAITRQAREKGVKMPFVLFSYYNPVLQLGLDRLIEEARQADISGMIIPDLPYEEDGPVRDALAQAGLYLIPLVAPTSRERIHRIVSRASGFIYCVSSLGVTGVREHFEQETDMFLRTVKEATDLPIAIGFGISNAEHVARFAQICDGVIVGSAIVRKIEENLTRLKSEREEDKREGLREVHLFVQELCSGLKR